MKRMILSSSELIAVDSEGNEVPEGMNHILRQSKIRNRKGQLRVCYHGTDSEFTEFKEEFVSTNSGNIGWFGKGFYFTDSAKLAGTYGKNVRKFYLDIRNPFIYSSEDSIYTLLSLGISPRVYDSRLQPYAYLDDPFPIEEFTQTVKEAGYDGVVFSYRQGRYKPPVSGTSSASEFVCFRPDQIIEIEV